MIFLILVLCLFTPVTAFASTVWSLATTATGWTWVAPTGQTSVCKTVDLAVLSPNSTGQTTVASGVSAKYGGSLGTAWAQAASNRMRSWGLNAAGQYSADYGASTPSLTNPIPFSNTYATGGYAMDDNNAWHVKNYNHMPNTLVCGSNTPVTPSGGGGRNQFDVFDPNIATAFNALTIDPTGPVLFEKNNGSLPWYFMIVPEEGDYQAYMSGIVGSPDGGYMIAAGDPVQTVSSTEITSGYVYPNSTQWAKQAMRDYLATEYGCVSGTAVSISSISEIGNVVTVNLSSSMSLTGGQLVEITGVTPSTYNGPHDVIPQNLSSTSFQYLTLTTGLSAGSGGTVALEGSADPSAANYCGSTLASSSLTALNSAWGTGSTSPPNYTTWNTSAAGGLTSIATAGGNAQCTGPSTPYACCSNSGTGTCTAYSAWGSGTGFLDENGTHLVKTAECSGTGSQGPTPIDPWGLVTQIQTDVEGFMQHFATQYGMLIYNAYQQPAVQPHPPVFASNYQGPNYELLGMSFGFNGFVMQGEQAGNTSSLTASSTLVQRYINSINDHPIVIIDYSESPPDGAVPAGGCNNFYNNCTTTEGGRASWITSLWSQSLALQNNYGHYAVIGLSHWSYWDFTNCGSGTDCQFGFVSPYDNPYDQSAEIHASTGNWTASHAYTAPVIIFDGTNYEALSDSLTSCTSGASTPSWNTNEGGTTNDGSGGTKCVWRNEGSATLVVEAGTSTDTTAPQSTATFPNVGYGDLISPISNFLAGGICDPASTGGVGGSNGVHGLGSW